MKDNNLEKPKPIRKIPNKKAPKPPRFNFMWIYAVVIAAFFIITMLVTDNNGKQVAFQPTVISMLKNGDVDHITAYKTGDFVTGEVFIKKSSLDTKAQYKEVAKNDNLIGTSGPQYTFTDATTESLQKHLADAQKGMPD